ncbi:mCG54161, isoform CRA_a [Mus musculus]|nr:mCG54161, isoform CRA_a [Mus musculus]
MIHQTFPQTSQSCWSQSRRKTTHLRSWLDREHSLLPPEWDQSRHLFSGFLVPGLFWRVGIVACLHAW